MLPYSIIVLLLVAMFHKILRSFTVVLTTASFSFSILYIAKELASFNDTLNFVEFRKIIRMVLP